MDLQTMIQNAIQEQLQSALQGVATGVQVEADEPKTKKGTKAQTKKGTTKKAQTKKADQPTWNPDGRATVKSRYKALGVLCDHLGIPFPQTNADVDAIVEAFGK